MKITLALAGLFMLASPKEYPALVRIKQTHWHTHNGYSSGYGHGNVTEDGHIQGFDYVFNGCDAFDASHGPGGYAARWKDPHKLVISMAEIGSDKHHECELKVTLRNFVYVMHDGNLSTRPIGGSNATDQ